MAAVHILIFGEMVGSKIVPFIATHMKMKKFSWSYEKKNSANQNLPICIKTTDIKLYGYAKYLNAVKHRYQINEMYQNITKCR